MVTYISQEEKSTTCGQRCWEILEPWGSQCAFVLYGIRKAIQEQSCMRDLPDAVPSKELFISDWNLTSEMLPQEISMASLKRCNKLPQTGWLKTTNLLFFHSSRGQKFRRSYEGLSLPKPWNSLLASSTSDGSGCSLVWGPITPVSCHFSFSFLTKSLLKLFTVGFSSPPKERFLLFHRAIVIESRNQTWGLCFYDHHSCMLTEGKRVHSSGMHPVTTLDLVLVPCWS